ncbi:hypothetical protein J2046_003062 [Rhizobium petrolearium]|uniref:hypothetical protein n=1 Tax=Neorhizobium petrolearium TaxID=515361 RepID=UPI001AE8D580|nr:hypothetical protein [Neorhizobium petrolearium]MBP1844795.1 hypothetical protein [Neorhizobium petrolearium]
MEFHSARIDKKIMGINCLIEMSVKEYYQFAQNILDKNEYQRTKVKSAAKTYELLERDMIAGCVIPPIILSITGDISKKYDALVRSCLEKDIDEERKGQLELAVDEAFATSSVMILDGLQRTYTIKSIMDGNLADGKLDAFLATMIRFEVYLGLSKQGILYRMLTLNTGQTPMSFRHQLEILYKDYIDADELPDGIKVYREVDEARARGISKYKYSDVVDMFYAFSTASPMPYDKQALVGTLKEMEFLESYKFEEKGDEMTRLLVLHNKFVIKVSKISNDWTYNAERFPDGTKPFGTNIEAIFTKAQSMAGFGAECKRLIEHGLIKDLDGIALIIDGLRFSEAPEESMDLLILSLAEVSGKAKKIGDAQRLYFQLGFRALFTEAFETAQDMSKAWVRGQEAYGMMYGS